MLNLVMLVISKHFKGIKIDIMELPKNKYNGWLDVARLVSRNDQIAWNEN